MIECKDFFSKHLNVRIDINIVNSVKIVYIMFMNTKIHIIY